MVVQLSAAGGTYPIETAPRFMQALHAWLPVTHSVDGMRSLIAGGPFDAAGVLLPLAGWTLASFAGLVAVVLVTWRKVHGARGHGAHDARSGADDGTETAADLESADDRARRDSRGRVARVKNCLSFVVGALMVLSHLWTVFMVIIVIIDVSDPFRWGMLGVSLVVAVVLTVILRLLGHRVADAYDVLSFFNW
jgi:hypothetical protein